MESLENKTKQIHKRQEPNMDRLSMMELGIYIKGCRDVDELMEYFAKNNDKNMIFSDGKKVSFRDIFIKLHNLRKSIEDGKQIEERDFSFVTRAGGIRARVKTLFDEDKNINTSQLSNRIVSFAKTNIE